MIGVRYRLYHIVHLNTNFIEIYLFLSCSVFKLRDGRIISKINMFTRCLLDVGDKCFPNVFRQDLNVGDQTCYQHRELGNIKYQSPTSHSGAF